MSKKRAKPYDVLTLCKELATISTMANTNYNPTIDGARVEAAELVVKHSGDEKMVVAARDVLVEAARNGGVLVQHRVRAIRVLLEHRSVFGTIDAVNAQVDEGES